MAVKRVMNDSDFFCILIFFVHLYKSESPVCSNSLIFFQVIVFHAQGKSKHIDRKVAEIKKPAIHAGDDYIWSEVGLLVPPLPPSKLQFCNNIEINYLFKVRL